MIKLRLIKYVQRRQKLVCFICVDYLIFLCDRVEIYSLDGQTDYAVLLLIYYLEVCRRITLGEKLSGHCRKKCRDGFVIFFIHTH